MQETLVDYRETYSFQPVDSFSASRLSDAPTLEQVLQVAERLRAAEPQYRYLCTLDDVNQSCYTRGHALEDERLTFDYDYDDLDLDDPESVRAYESRRLAHVVAQLQDPQLQQAWESLPGTLYVNAGDIAALAAMNRDPQRVLDQVVYVQRVPVPEDNLLIAGMVNGYFSADWDVFQNHAIIRRRKNGTATAFRHRRGMAGLHPPASARRRRGAAAGGGPDRAVRRPDDEQGEAAPAARTGPGRAGQQGAAAGLCRGFRGDPGIATQMGKRRDDRRRPGSLARSPDRATPSPSPCALITCLLLLVIYQTHICGLRYLRQRVD